MSHPTPTAHPPTVRGRWAIVALGAIVGGWMLFDGVRALVVGDYVTPSAGEYAGQLGPWAALVQGLGLDPRSTAVKLAHVLGGTLWLDASAAAFLRLRAARALVAAAALASLWYLPFGTLAGVVALVLLARARPAPPTSPP